MRRYAVVFLDAQGTLLRAKPSLVGIYGQVFRRFGRDVTEGEITGVVADIWAEYRAALDPERTAFDTSDELTRLWWADFNGRLFDRLAVEGDRQAFLDALWDVFGLADNWDLFPEVPEVLATLRERGYRLAVVSNWDSRLLEICDHLELSPMVEFVVASAAVGMEKPDPRIFEIALSMAGVSADQAIHVGDDYAADVLGARGAGVDAVLLDRAGHTAPSEGSLTIRSLRELPHLLS